MAKLLIMTQIEENYGVHNWDGKGETPQAWKFKGGNDYLVDDIDVNNAATIYQSVVSDIGENNDWYKEYVTNWEVIKDDWVHPYGKEYHDQFVKTLEVV